MRAKVIDIRRGLHMLIYTSAISDWRLVDWNSWGPLVVTYAVRVSSGRNYTRRRCHAWAGEQTVVGKGLNVGITRESHVCPQF